MSEIGIMPTAGSIHAVGVFFIRFSHLTFCLEDIIF
jgi:hypothetical protein